MIPKIIHYCWFGRGEKPQKVLDCIATWKAILPEYTIKEWNEDNFDYKAIPYTYEAYLAEKYAYVSDVARLYALLTEGGIYLDTDVRVIKSFNPFLDQHSFLSMESPFRVSTAVIGAEKKMNWISDFYASYKKRHFIRKKGLLNDIPNTIQLSQFLELRYPSDELDLKIFNIDVFCAHLFFAQKYMITSNTICVHEYTSSWMKPISRLEQLNYAFKRFLIEHVYND